ncbi:hypothetical protein MMC18_005982 [Xylographa bjoerkii]|nr:hypothetical protein [Xylographa bjoerkii]
MPRIEPSKPQLRYAAPEPNMQVAQPVARLHNYDPSYENLFDWDKDASDPTENRNYGNIHTTAGFNTYNPTAQLSSGMLSREHDIERSHDNEHMYDRSNYRDIGLDNDHNKFGEMNFQTRYDTENAEDDLEPETPGHGLDLSGHDAHSPSFCWDHCFSIPLNSLPAPSASFAEEEAPEGA